jgi:hypothetical protein
VQALRSTAFDVHDGTSVSVVGKYCRKRLPLSRQRRSVMLPGSLFLRRIGVIAAPALLAMTTGALAQSHPLTLGMSCDQARNLVSSQRAIVLNTSEFTYGRYVGSYGYCVLGETTEPAWVPTADTPQCPIGYQCVARTRPARN